MSVSGTPPIITSGTSTSWRCSSCRGASHESVARSAACGRRDHCACRASVAEGIGRSRQFAHQQLPTMTRGGVLRHAKRRPVIEVPGTDRQRRFRPTIPKHEDLPSLPVIVEKHGEPKVVSMITAAEINIWAVQQTQQNDGKPNVREQALWIP